MISENPYNYCILRKKVFHQYLPRFLGSLEPSEAKFTVYGLRFSKTTFWNRINTGFLEPAVATALTACGIETSLIANLTSLDGKVATALTACGIETPIKKYNLQGSVGLQRRLPLAVLKLAVYFSSKLRGSCNGAYRLRY